MYIHICSISRKFFYLNAYRRKLLCIYRVYYTKILPLIIHIADTISQWD